MEGMMLHCGANLVEEQEVLAVETPPSTRTHYPVPHSLLINLIGKMLDNVGWSVVKREYALFKDGARLFGVWAIQNGSTNDSDYGLTIGIRNSHDKRFPVGMVVGSHVFVCDNLCFSGSIRLVAKHTLNVFRDLPQKVFDSFSKLQGANTLQQERIAGYKSKILGTTEVHDFLIRSVDEKVIPNSYVPTILYEFRNPRHEEFLLPSDNGNERHTAWTLMNAYTQKFKSTNALDLPGRSIRLHSMLDQLTFGEEQIIQEAEVVNSVPGYIDTVPGLPPVFDPAQS